MDESAFAGSLAASTLDRRVRAFVLAVVAATALLGTAANAIEFERNSYDRIPVGLGADAIVAERATEGAGTLLAPPITATTTSTSFGVIGVGVVRQPPTLEIGTDNELVLSLGSSLVCDVHGLRRFSLSKT